MDLFWLKYLSYTFIAVAACLYIAIRMNRLTRHAGIRAAFAYAACIALACIAWRVQESNTQHHSPRRLVVGTVASVNADSRRGGEITDEFRLKVGSSLSPTFSTDTVADSAAHQPIHQGDVLGVLYRTWDNVPLTIDELQGQNTGWHYEHTSDAGAFIFAVSIAGALGLLSILLSLRNLRPTLPASGPTFNFKD